MTRGYGRGSGGTRRDPATGRKMRESNALFRRRERDPDPPADGQGQHGPRRQNGQVAERRVDWRRREVVRRGAR